MIFLAIKSEYSTSLLNTNNFIEIDSSIVESEKTLSNINASKYKGEKQPREHNQTS